MTPTNSYILNPRNISLTVCLLFMTLYGAQAQTPDLNKIWTTVGSEGTVDETDVGKVFFQDGMVQMGRLLAGNFPVIKKKAVTFHQTRSAVIRYNITPVDGLFARPGGDLPGVQLKLRYLAGGGGGARVTARLIEVDLGSGTETARLIFNSSAFPMANNYQVQAVAKCGTAAFRFDFVEKAYYIEATLTSSALIGGSAAGIQIIKVENIPCFT